MAAGRSVDYYTQLAQEDYYSLEEGPGGVWLGKACEGLGLQGGVADAEFRSLYQGVNPLDGRPLHRQGVSHHPGWDLTFSAPKSVSVLWSLADAETRRGIQGIHLSAVSGALAYLEDHAALTRRGRGGTRTEPVVGLVAAAFQHSTNRAQEPQLHSHCFVFNVAPRSDGTVGTLVGREFFRHKMRAGLHYRTELARGLSRELGLPVQWSDGLFEVVGVSKSVVDGFSSRRKAIVKVMNERGLTSPRAAAAVALRTRQPKRIVPRATLFERWQRRGEELGFTVADARELVAKHAPPVQSGAVSNFGGPGITRKDLTEEPFSDRGLTLLRSLVKKLTLSRRPVVVISPFASGAAVLARETEEVGFSARAFQRALRTKSFMESLSSALRYDRGFRPLKGLLRDAERARRPTFELKRGSVVLITGYDRIGYELLTDIKRRVRKAGGEVVLMRQATITGEPELMASLRDAQRARPEKSDVESVRVSHRRGRW